MTLTHQRRPELAQVAGGSALTALGGVVSGVAGFALLALVAGSRGPTAAGVFGIGVAVAAVVTQVGKLGCDTALVHFLPRWREAGDQAPDVRRALVGVFAVVGGLGVLSGVVTWVAAPALGRLLLAGEDPALSTRAVQMVAVGLPPAALTAVVLAATRGCGVVRYLVVNDQIAKPVLRLVLVGLVIGGGRGVDAALLAWSAVPWVLLPWALRSLNRLVDLRPSARAAARPRAGRMAGLLPDGLARFAGLRLASASVEIVGMQVGLLVVGAGLGVAEAGVYAVATRLVLAGYLTMQAVRLVVAPHLSALLDRRRREEAELLHQASSAWIVLTAWPAYLVLAVLSPSVLRLLGDGFVSGWPVLSIVALSGLVSVGAGNVQTVLLMGGLPGAYLLIAAGSLACNVLALAVLVPAAGAEGAAVALLIACVVENGLTIVVIRRRLGVRHFGAAVLLAGLLTTATVGTAAATARAVGAGLAADLGLVLLGGVLLALCCWPLREQLHLSDLSSVVRSRR